MSTGPNPDLDGLKNFDTEISFATSFGTYLHTARGVAREGCIPPAPPAPLFDTDEWRVYGTSGLAVNIEGIPDDPGPDRIWDANITGTFFPSSTPFGLWLQRRTVLRTAPPTTTTITSDTVNSSSAAPTVVWTTSNGSDPLILEFADGPLGLWRFTQSGTPSAGIPLSSRGVLTIGGPLPGLRTVLTVGPGFYPTLSYEYVWQA